MLLRSDRMEAGSGLGLVKKWPDSCCHAQFSYSLKHKVGLSEGLHYTSWCRFQQFKKYTPECKRVHEH